MSESYYGRITTQHDHLDNIGRAAPKLLYGYTYENRMVNRKGVLTPRLVERNVRFGKSHTSRNTLIRCDSPEKRSQVKEKVLEWMERFPNVKQKDDIREAHEFVQFVRV